MPNLKFIHILIAICLSLLSCTTLADASPADTNVSASKEAGLKLYHLNTGDRVRIEVYGEDDLKRDVTLTDQGKISYPFLGELELEGLTLKALEEMITKGLKGSFLINPEVSVSVLEYRPFFINGEISNSGSYTYQPGLTLRKAIALAGGITEYASKDNISVIRENDATKESIVIDLNTPILAGDIISVAGSKPVFINGQVKNPGSYPFQSGLTLRKVIALAGGFTDRADQDNGYIISDGNEDQDAIESDLEDNISPGDIITIKQSFF